MLIARVSREAADLHARVDHGLPERMTRVGILFAAFRHEMTDTPEAPDGQVFCLMCASDPEHEALDLLLEFEALDAATAAQ